jgi:hypothetical protein
MIWIDANKQKPESGQCVLLYSPESGVGEGAWIGKKKHFEQWRWNAVVKGVTYWAPLPSGPEKKDPHAINRFIELEELNLKMNEVLAKIRETNKRIVELEDENKQLRHEMGIMIEKPDAPEAAAIVMQWVFAKEIEKGYETGEVDIPKLLGVYGKLINPIKKEE